MDLLTARRRAMLAAGGGNSEWDVEWDYTMGLPNSNGWVASTSGSYKSASMQDDGLLVKAANSCRYAYQKADAACAVGVIEAVLYVPSHSSTSNLLMAFLHIGNADAGLRVYFYNTSSTKAVRLNNNSTLKNGTNLGSFSFDTEYKVTLKINNGIGQYYLDDVLKRDNIDLSAIVDTGAPCWGCYNGGANPNYYGAVWKSVKVKVGRI